MTTEPSDYRMRGHRVHEFSRSEITDIASRVCEVVKILKRSFSPGRVEKLINKLETYGIHVDVIDDEEWLDATRATVDPQAGMIYMPEKLHSDLRRGKAEAIRIFLHELGHIFLCHKPLLHFSETQPRKEHDSEWQADFFADSVIELLGLKKIDMQLELKF